MSSESIYKPYLPAREKESRPYGAAKNNTESASVHSYQLPGGSGQAVSESQGKRQPPRVGWRYL